MSARISDLFDGRPIHIDCFAGARGYRLGKAKTKKDQVRLIGNSVVPQVMEAVVRANLGEQLEREAA